MAVMHARPVALLLILTAGIFAPLRAQSLAEVAKKEQERRKTVPKPAKVYTNKDLRALPPGSAPPPSTGASAAADAPKAAGTDKATSDKEGTAKDQAYWSGRMKAVQDKLDRDQTFAEALKTRVNSLTADFVNRDDPAQRRQIELDRQKAVAELARLQQDIVNDKKAVADLEDEARRAGVPPGWLR
jgi:hypothetical protein